MKNPDKFPHTKRQSIGKRNLLRADPELAWKRDEILEADRTFCENVRALYRRVAAGKLPQTAVRRVQPNLIMAALRRAGVSLRHSQRLARA